jgi:hypothetical protein
MSEMSNESYSQACQDKFVLSVHKYKKNGFFIYYYFTYEMT